MPLLETEANKLSQELLERGVIEEIIDRDELFALFPFKTVNGKAYLYNREKTLSEGEFLDPYEAVPEGAATFDEVTTRLRILAGDVDMDKFLLSTQSDSNPQLAIQIAAKAKALSRKFRRTLVNGNNGVNSKEFDGLKVLTPAAQTLVAGANGAAVTFSMLDELKDTVKNGADCFMMRLSTWRAIRALLRGMGGNTAETIMIPNFGKPVPAIDGMPVIVNDFITTDEVMGSSSATTSIYAMKLDESVGLHGIVGGEAAGLKVEEIGTIQNKDAVRYRVKWYVGTALKSTQSIARLKGITNI
jgi:HK97 family phage major capsid protein